MRLKTASLAFVMLACCAHLPSETVRAQVAPLTTELVARSTVAHEWELTVASWNLMNLSMNTVKLVTLSSLSFLFQYLNH